MVPEKSQMRIIRLTFQLTFPREIVLTPNLHRTRGRGSQAQSDSQAANHQAESLSDSSYWRDKKLDYRAHQGQKALVYTEPSTPVPDGLHFRSQN